MTYQNMANRKIPKNLAVRVAPPRDDLRGALRLLRERGPAGDDPASRKVLSHRPSDPANREPEVSPEVLVLSRYQRGHELGWHGVEGHVLAVLFFEEDPELGGAIAVVDRRFLADQALDVVAGEVITRLADYVLLIEDVARDRSCEGKQESRHKEEPDEAAQPGPTTLTHERARPS